MVKAVCNEEEIERVNDINDEKHNQIDKFMI